MKPIEVFVLVGAGGLAAFGLYTYARSRPKAEETVPGIPPQVPTHPGVSGQERTSLCQVLTGYRSKLKEYEDLRADAEKRCATWKAWPRATAAVTPRIPPSSTTATAFQYAVSTNGGQ